MKYILDTNVISELSKRRPSPAIVQFFKSVAKEQIWLSVMTLGEIRLGVVAEERRNPQAAMSIARWLETTENHFQERTLPVTAEIAQRWSAMSADRTRPVVDTLIAATAMVHDLTVVTRNERDYRGLGVRLLNPWAS